MKDINRFLDGVFMDSARKKEEEQKGKQYSYKLFSGLFMDNLKASGKCEVVKRRYDKTLDCDVLTCRDLTTNETFCCNQFAIELKEIA